MVPVNWVGSLSTRRPVAAANSTLSDSAVSNCNVAPEFDDEIAAASDCTGNFQFFAGGNFDSPGVGECRIGRNQDNVRRSARSQHIAATDADRAPRPETTKLPLTPPPTSPKMRVDEPVTVRLPPSTVIGPSTVSVEFDATLTPLLTPSRLSEPTVSLSEPFISKPTLVSTTAF